MIRVFFSYSHDNDAHKLWVRKLADDLRNRGFDVVLDQTELRPGQDILHFVEAAVESSDFVLLVCTPSYARKANGRVQGVGMETVLITTELYEGATGKFIALLRSGPHQNAIPKYMKTRLFVDMSDGSEADRWETLCRHMLEHGASDQIGTLVFEALFPYDASRIHDEPRLRELKRFTQFIKSGRNPDGRWYVCRRDPIKNDLATILFQEPGEPS